MVIAHLPVGTLLPFDEVQRRQRATRKLLQASAGSLRRQTWRSGDTPKRNTRMEQSERLSTNHPFFSFRITTRA